MTMKLDVYRRDVSAYIPLIDMIILGSVAYLTSSVAISDVIDFNQKLFLSDVIVFLTNRYFPTRCTDPRTAFAFKGWAALPLAK